MAPRGDFFTFFLPTRIGEGYSQAPYAQIQGKFWKKSGKFTPPPPGTQKTLNIRWFNRGNPRNPQKFRKKSGKNRFSGGVWVFTWRTEGPQAYVPIERTHGTNSGNNLVYITDLSFVSCLLFVTSGVFWGGIRYSLHVFSERIWNVP